MRYYKVCEVFDLNPSRRMSFETNRQLVWFFLHFSFKILNLFTLSYSCDTGCIQLQAICTCLYELPSHVTNLHFGHYACPYGCV